MLEVPESLEAARAVAGAAAAGGGLVAALGGDGMAGAIAEAVADAGGVFVLLPSGRGNDFARAMGVPRDAVAAARGLRRGVEQSVDLGRCGGRRFLGVACSGFDSVVSECADSSRLRGTAFVYPWATVATIGRLRPHRFALEIDGERRELEAISVAVSNSGRHGGGMRPAPSASLTDGLLDVVVFGPIGRRRLVRGLPHMFDGTCDQADFVEVVQCRTVALENGDGLSLWADGERLGTLPAEVSVDEGALRMLVPAG